jgi:type IV pilus assembly protein PilY1
LGKAPYKPLFTAADDKAARQPITAQPRVVFAPGGGYLVLVGTGKFVERSDTELARFGTQSFYAVHDNGQTVYEVKRGELMLRSLRMAAAEGNAIEVSGDTFLYGSAPTSKKGWYFDFPESEKTGERAIAAGVVANGKLFFNSLIPDREPCGPGAARTYIVDVLSGLPPGGRLTGLVSDGALLGQPVLVQARAEASERSPVGRRTVKKKATVLNAAGNDGQSISSKPAPHDESTSMAGRLSWREIVNWQELRDAAAKQ